MTVFRPLYILFTCCNTITLKSRADSPRSSQSKVNQFASAILNSKHIICRIVKSRCCVARFHIFLQKLDKLVQSAMQLQVRRGMILYRIYSIKHRDIHMYY